MWPELRSCTQELSALKVSSDKNLDVYELGDEEAAKSTTKIECFVIVSFAIWYPPTG